MNARRDKLDGVSYDPQYSPFHPHVGLWFDKYLEEQVGETLGPYVRHIESTGEIRESLAYRDFFNRWQAELEELEKIGAQIREADVVGRLAAGLGGASVIENAMTLHHTYGVPIIPGSSLKGTARAYATDNLAGAWGVTEDDKGKKVYGDAFKTLFGNQERVGIVVFYDALPIPGSFGIHNEVMTVHHRDYYQTGEKPPADWDSPSPIPFPSVHGRFLIALHAPSAPEWAAQGMEILKMALVAIGVGGKTSSGYGRLVYKPPPGYHRGTVEKFGLGANKSYGFILLQESQEEVFVHRDNLREGIGDLHPGDVVDFRVETDQKGRKQARDVHFC